MFRQLLFILDYYRIFASWSFGVNIIIAIMNPTIFLALATKLFLTFLLWYLVTDIPVKKRFLNKRNIVISNGKLFSILFLIDSLVTIPFIILIKGFI